MLKLFPISILALLLTSCSTSKMITSNITPQDISSMHYFEPVAEIDYIEKGNNTLPSDSLSAISGAKLDSIWQQNSGKYRLAQKIQIKDQDLQRNINSELKELFEESFTTKNTENLNFSPGLDSLMAATNNRFAMATYVSGFERRKGNYAGEAIRGAAIGILTLGFYAPIPVKSNIMVHTLILDAESKNIAFYRHSLSKEKSPTDPEILTKEFDRIFNGYFYN